MAVTIVGTLEQIFTSGGETVSEAVHVNFESPTDAPLPLHEAIVFTERNPPVDIRIPLEAHLEEDHGFTSVTRVPVSRAGAMAEWTAVRTDSVAAEVVLWETVPLVQEGIEWGVTAVSDERALWAYQSIPIGDGAEATGEASIAIGYNAKSGGESSAAMGHDASAAGKQGLAVGRGSNAGGINSIAIGVDSDASGLDSTAVGQGAIAEGVRSTAVGRSSATPGEDSLAAGDNALALANTSTALGAGASVQAGSLRSTAIGAYAEVGIGETDTTVIAAKDLMVKPHALASTLASIITLHDASGNPHAIPAWVGQTHSHSGGGSPGGENTTLIVSNMGQAKVMWSGALGDLIPEASTGTWDVKISVAATVYRSVATGGIYLYVGNLIDFANALGRLGPQNSMYAITRTHIIKDATSSTALEARYGGFSTAGTTHVVTYDVDVTAVRTG